MKKIISLCILLIQVFVLSACNGSSENSEVDGDVKTEPIVFRDLGGEEYILKGLVDMGLCPEEGITAAGDKQHAWWRETERLLNCKITYAVGVWTWELTEIPAAVATGEKVCDFMYINGTHMYKLAKGGFLESFDNLDTIDPLDETKWAQYGDRKPSLYKGVTYGLIPGDSTTVPGMQGGPLLCNNELIKQFNVVSPYELYEQKKWTFDTFKEYLPTVSDTTAGHEIYGLICTPTYILPKTAVIANGGSLTIKNGDSEIFGYTQLNAITAIEWAKEIVGMKGIYKEEQWASPLFAGGGGTFLMHNPGVAFITEDWSPNMHLKDYGFVRFPYGPSAEYGKTPTAYTTMEGYIYSMPLGVDVENVSYLIDVWCNKKRDPNNIMSQKEIDEEREIWRRNSFHNDNSYFAYDADSKNTHVDGRYELFDLNPTIYNALQTAVTGKKSVIEIMSSIEEQVNLAMAEG